MADAIVDLVVNLRADVSGVEDGLGAVEQQLFTKRTRGRTIHSTRSLSRNRAGWCGGRSRHCLLWGSRPTHRGRGPTDDAETVLIGGTTGGGLGKGKKSSMVKG